MNTIGSFILVRDEAPWIAGHLAAWLPHLDQMVFMDGFSTDGTLEILRAFEKEYPGKLKIYEGQDPANLEDAYVEMFNKALHSLDTDLAFFAHPDMLPAKTPDMKRIRESEAVALSVKMRSFAGEPNGQLFEIVEGRGDAWKNIYRLKPDLGAHYHGHYGAWNEDVYFKDITGSEHKHYGPDFQHYPYVVEDSGLEVLHFSDVRTPRRRYERMVRCLMNQGRSPEKAREMAAVHPRVTLKPEPGFKLVPAEYPAEFLAATEKYAHFRKEPACL